MPLLPHRLMFFYKTSCDLKRAALCRPIKLAAGGTARKKGQAWLRGGPGFIFPFLHDMRWASAIEQRQRVCQTSRLSALDKWEGDDGVGDMELLELGPPPERSQPKRNSSMDLLPRKTTRL